MEVGELAKSRTPSVFVFNPFTEGYIAQGKGFTPVKHQAMLAEDLANLPQFLGEPGDIVLVPKRPSREFLDTLQQSGFALPEFVELREGRIDPAGALGQRTLGSLRPWAWGPDSVELFEPLFGSLTGDTRGPSGYFNHKTSRLYSKAWSADFLKKVLGAVRSRGFSRPVEASSAALWLCSEEEAGVVVNTLEEALGAVAAIRGRGHHRVVAKEALGLAGHNAIRLWEPEMLPAQRQWLAHALSSGRPLVVEPWLEREVDFSVQLEMGARNLKLCGYTGLINDRKGQFLANWAEADYTRCMPLRAAELLHSPPEISKRLEHLYRELFSLLEAELEGAGFVGPVSIDAFVYRTSQGEPRLKPVVEINPRCTMGRLTVELMKHTCAGSTGVFRLVGRAQARADGFAHFSNYARARRERFPLCLAGEPTPKIREGFICLNDPGEARVCLATFEVSPKGVRQEAVGC